MKWYYSKKGNVGKRGQADFEVLLAMAADGRLAPDDLVCSESSPRWLPASQVEGLFTANDKPDKRKKRPARRERDEEAPVRPVRDRNVRARHLREIILAIFCVGIFAIWQFKPHIPGFSSPSSPFAAPPTITVPLVAPPEVSAPQPETAAAVMQAPAAPEAAADQAAPAPEPVLSEEHRAWYGLCERFEANMRNADIGGATRTLERMIQDYGANEVTTSYRDRLIAMKKSFQDLDTLKIRLLAGTLDHDAALRLAELSGKYDRPGHLRDLMRDTLSNTVNQTSAKCVAVLRTAILVLDLDMARRAASEYAARLDSRAIETDCLEVVSMCNRVAMTDSADLVLQSYLAANPDSARAWFETAALRADAGLSKEAIQALQQAVKLGGKPVKLAAQDDKRFDPIRDSRAFRKCVK